MDKTGSAKMLLWGILAIISFLLFLILSVVSSKKVNSLKDQLAYQRWSSEGGSGQVSVFTSKDAEIDEFRRKGFEYELDKALSDAGVEKQSESARLYIDAYSARGTITLVSERGKLEASAIGIGGDFFYFHPLTLVSGRYFSGEELMQDHVILDEDAAWQLFGSTDIEGMMVEIAGVPHTIAGVVKRDNSTLAKKAGLSKTIVYVSTETLTEYGSSEGISCYELTGANPVKGFLAETVREKFGLKEEQMLVVDNSERFKLEAMIPVILDFGSRSMQNSAIRFPYWENMARGVEDQVALLLLLRFVFLVIPVCVILVFGIIKWKGRKYKGKEFWKVTEDKIERSMEKIRARRNGK